MRFKKPMVAVGGDVSHVAPIYSRRRRVSRRTNQLDCDVRHVASYLCAAKVERKTDRGKQIRLK